ncbi:MAG: hypothetical protein ACSLFM_04340, partial [Tepidiformaceae bacterium]
IARSTGVAADQGKRRHSYSFAPSTPWNTQRNTWKVRRGHHQIEIAFEALPFAANSEARRSAQVKLPAKW